MTSYGSDLGLAPARAGSRKNVSPTARDKIGARVVFMQRLLGDYVIPSAVVLDSRGQPDSRSPVNRPHVIEVISHDVT